MTSPILTIMIPTTVDRRPMFKSLFIKIWSQIFEHNFHNDVEVIFEEDNKEISVGRKRQNLLVRSKGTWVVGIDSDDDIADTYILDIVSSLKLNPSVDHIGFIEDCTINGEKSKSLFSIKHKKWAENTDGYDHIRCANPKSVIRRSKALMVGFEDMRYGEDIVFSERVTPLLDSEIFINKPLYLYNHISTEHYERYGISHDAI